MRGPEEIRRNIPGIGLEGNGTIVSPSSLDPGMPVGVLLPEPWTIEVPSSSAEP